MPIRTAAVPARPTCLHGFINAFTIHRAGFAALTPAAVDRVVRFLRTTLSPFQNRERTESIELCNRTGSAYTFEFATAGLQVLAVHPGSHAVANPMCAWRIAVGIENVRTYCRNMGCHASRFEMPHYHLLHSGFAAVAGDACAGLASLVLPVGLKTQFLTSIAHREKCMNRDHTPTCDSISCIDMCLQDMMC